jgi:hypothetical protein
MGSRNVAAAVLTMAFLAGCTMRTQAPVSASTYDFSERDTYGQSFAASPTYAGQDTSWTTTAPARAVGALRNEEAPGIDAAPAKAKGTEEGGEGKFGSVGSGAPGQGSAPAIPPAPARPASRPTSTPPQGAQSPSLAGSGASGR